MLTVSVQQTPKGPPMANPSNDREEGNVIPHDRAILRIVNEAMKALREVSPTIPVTEVQLFVTVALNEGLSQTELCELTDLKKSTASRYLLDLSDKTRAGTEGFGLISRSADPQELRRNMYSLTPKGRVLIKRIINQGR